MKNNNLSLIKKIFSGIVLISVFSFLPTVPSANAGVSPCFNCMENDFATMFATLTLKDVTRGDSSYQTELSGVSPGDEIRLKIYIHLNNKDNTGLIGRNTQASIDFPTTAQTTISLLGKVWADNVDAVYDSSQIILANVPPYANAQKLEGFQPTAKLYSGQDSYDLPVDFSIPGTARVMIGDILSDNPGCFDHTFQLVFTAKISKISVVPTVDIKANSSDGPITINYNTSANLTWTSTNATSCTASGSWSGTKAVSGSESTGNLTSSQIYTIVCTGAGGSTTDSVSVNVNVPTLSVDLEAIPNSGNAPLNGVDLKATVSGTAAGTINYKFDCTNDGNWDYTFYNISDNPKTVVDACNYTYAGTYIAKVYVERGGANPAEDIVAIQVQSNPAPTVDLKANSSDGPITINYNTSANLTWTSTNATSCTASGSWSGTKAVSGSESTGNLTSSRTYTITCTGPGGTVSDSVTVNISAQQNNPPTANAGPDKEIFEQGTVTLEGSGYDPDGDPVTAYWFCNGGTLSSSSAFQPVYTGPIVSYDTNYTCTLTVSDNRGGSSSDYMIVKVKDMVSGLTVSKLVKNISDGTSLAESVSADPGEVLSFSIQVSATGNSAAKNVYVKDTLPAGKIINPTNLTIDGVASSANIVSGFSIGDISPNQTKTITFEATVAAKDQFTYGFTTLVNTAMAYNEVSATTDTASINVIRSSTEIPTGFTNNKILDYLLLPLAMTLLAFMIFKKDLVFANEWWEGKKRILSTWQTKRILAKRISQIKAKERL
jgi:uncharacterized repeat protein (TIGR01451 family)